MTHLCCTACGVRASRAFAASAPTCPTCERPLEPVAASVALGCRLIADSEPAHAVPAALAQTLALPVPPDRA